VVLQTVAAAVALVFAVLAVIFVARSAWALWVDQLAGTVALLVIGAGVGYGAVRLGVGLRDVLTRRRALPRARIVRR
jgi:hypothetical protein